jgi:hypothetical protein
MRRYKPSSERKCATIALACPWPIPCSAFNMATISEWRALFIFFNMAFQCEIGLPYFFSMEGKYDAGPVTFLSAIATE